LEEGVEFRVLFYENEALFERLVVVSIEPADKTGILATGQVALQTFRDAERPRQPHVTLDRSEGRHVDASHQPQQRGLTRAVAAQDPGVPVAGKIEGDAPQHPVRLTVLGPVALVNVVQLYHAVMRRSR